MNDPYGPGPSNPPPPYGQPGYPPALNQPQYGYGPPPPGPQGYVSYGQGAAPPDVYTPGGPPFVNELRTLEDDSQLWLMVAAAGFWFGFGFITGPLAWYRGSQIRAKYRALGHHPCASANWARGLGIATTVIYLAGIAFVMLLLVVLGGALML